MDASEILKQLRDEIRALDWEKVADDNHRVLVAKHDVLDIVQEWIEYSLESDQRTAEVE